MRRLAGLKWIIPAIRAIQVFGTNLFRWFADRVSPKYISKVGMTGTARSMRMILAVRLLGCIGTHPIIPNNRLTGITHTGQTSTAGGL